MIEVNLIPDVKLELLKMKRQQTLVISISTIVAIVSIGVVVLMAVYTFAVQGVAETIVSGQIDDRAEKLKKVKDLSKTLTLQSQLNKLSSIQQDKNTTSRLFDIMSVTIPTDKNVIKISRLSLDGEENRIEVEAEAANGYEAMEVFKKTLAQTKLHYNRDKKAAKPVNIAKSISEGERNYGEDSQGNRILRFNLSFTYPDELFDATIENGKVVAPNQQRATDSTQGIPESLFSDGGKE